MPKANIAMVNPVLYAKIKAQQAALLELCNGSNTIIRVCPYCKHKIAEVIQGQHGYVITKCEKCGEEVVLPPVSFRLAR